MTGWKIDIKSETDARELGIYPREDSSFLDNEEEIEGFFDFEDSEIE